MNPYVTANTIKRLREKLNMTQTGLAEKLNVSDKAVSRWETGRGYPDITLIETLAQTLQVSVIELLSGDSVCNENKSFNLIKSRFYVCPVCGNIIHSTGTMVVCCCGITLPPLEAEAADGEHEIHTEKVEDELFVTMDHSMTKTHYISFFAWVSGDKQDFVKLYPEGNAQARMKIRGHGFLYAYCNRHGLFRVCF